VWDRLFGTYCIEDDAQALPTGLDDERFDTGRPLHDAVVAMRLWVANVKAAAVSSPA
jgi:sterol desaturase/sphingolipid hydroxylase (fatty acid hydroxylase superfamily)